MLLNSNLEAFLSFSLSRLATWGRASYPRQLAIVATGSQGSKHTPATLAESVHGTCSYIYCLVPSALSMAAVYHRKHRIR